MGRLTPEKLEQSDGRRYLRARRPELCGKLFEPQESVTLPSWQTAQPATRDDPAVVAGG